jgi:hypothetical protein
MMRLIFVLMLTIAISGCHIYSFTGASIEPGTKTVRVQTIENRADLVVPSLSQKMTLQLKNKFLNSTSLEQTTAEPDLDFTGEITGYTVTPLAAQANETAALNRLTITVNINHVNNKNPDKSWETSFSKFADFNATVDVSTVQEQLIDDISEQLAEAIFNKAVVNW